jgi:redox-sensitive bicupin YhaK (pirin superfamily)
MITRRAAADRGRSDFGWLLSRHTFSFGDYFDANHGGYRALRIINDDRVAGGGGFPRHPHRDMEIFSYVLDGALAHQDSLGTGSTIRRGEVQKMSAGTGIVHSEFNPDPDEPVHFLQVWILPERNGLPPSYEQKNFPESEKRGRLRLIGSRDGREGSIIFQQDVSIYASILAEGQSVRHPVDAGRNVWVQVARGAIDLDGTRLDEGDGAAVSGLPKVAIAGAGDAEILLFDLA